MAIGILFPILVLFIGRAVYPTLLENELTYLLWPNSRFVTEEIVRSTEKAYTEAEIMRLYGLAVFANAMLYLFVGAVVGFLVWLYRKLVKA